MVLSLSLFNRTRTSTDEAHDKKEKFLQSMNQTIQAMEKDIQNSQCELNRKSTTLSCENEFPAKVLSLSRK